MDWYEAGVEVEDEEGREMRVPGSDMWEARGGELMGLGDGEEEGEEYVSEDVYDAIRQDAAAAAAAAGNGGVAQRAERPREEAGALALEESGAECSPREGEEVLKEDGVDQRIWGIRWRAESLVEYLEDAAAGDGGRFVEKDGGKGGKERGTVEVDGIQLSDDAPPLIDYSGREGDKAFMIRPIEVSCAPSTF